LRDSDGGAVSPSEVAVRGRIETRLLVSMVGVTLLTLFILIIELGGRQALAGGP
jgi:hypothetical protein